jgi:arsenate reductase
MAAGFLTHLSRGRVEVRSAGSAPADQINPVAIAAMREVGIDISTAQPKILTPDAVKESDVCVTMGAATPAPTSPASAT